MWVQLGRETQNVNAILLENVQQLRVEIMYLRADNETLRLEQEKIMKNLLDMSNQRNLLEEILA